MAGCLGRVVSDVPAALFPLGLLQQGLVQFQALGGIRLVRCDSFLSSISALSSLRLLAPRAAAVASPWSWPSCRVWSWRAGGADLLGEGLVQLNLLGEGHVQLDLSGEDLVKLDLLGGGLVQIDLFGEGLVCGLQGALGEVPVGLHVVNHLLEGLLLIGTQLLVLGV